MFHKSHNILKGRKVLLSITDLLSHKLIVESENISNGYFTKSIPVANLSKGIYLITIETEKERLSRKILIY